MTTSRPPDYLDLYDYRLQVAAMYRRRNKDLADGDDPESVLLRFRAQRDRLFASHPQSALGIAERQEFRGLPYFPYNPEARVEATIDVDVDPQRLDVGTSGSDAMPMVRVADIHFRFDAHAARLSLYWIEVYGGGLFLPFRDATAPEQTYGGGRYLFDTVKGSDFESRAGVDGERRITLDFNYAYNPSCAYNPRWTCPLAPRDNHLPFAIPVGEMTRAHRLEAIT